MNFSTAQLSISKPDSIIEFGKTYTINLTLNFDTIKSILSKEKITVSDQIEVKLRGSSFSISANKPAVQYLVNNRVLNWNWQINPNQIGRQFIELEVSSTVLFNQQTQKRTISNFKRTYYYQVNTDDYINNWLKKYGFQFALILILLITFFLLFQFRKNAKRLKKQIKK